MSPLLRWREMTELVSRGFEDSLVSLAKRINITLDSTSSPEQIAASKQDPWSKSSKYALGWVYFSIVLLVLTSTVRLYHVWGDKIRTALYKEDTINSGKAASPGSDYEQIGRASCRERV